MRIRPTLPSRLTPEELAIWRTIQRQREGALGSPYFCPEYTLAVAAVRDDVEVAVLEDKGEVVGFVPFQRTRLQVGVSVGGRLADFSGAVVRDGVDWDAMELVRECRLAGLHLRNVPVSLGPLVPYRRKEEDSPFIDLSRGYEAYREERRASGITFIPRQMRKSRKLEREAGPLRFQLHTRDPRVLHTLLAWKSEQRRRTRTVDVLGHRWVVELLKRLCATETEGFAGLLSALYAGDTLVAVHFGMRAPAVLHSWFPAYNRAFGDYSPGLLLLLELLREAPSRGMTRFDLGRGLEDYKLRTMTGSIRLMDAPVDRSAAARLATNVWYGGRRWARGSAAGDVLRGAKRIAQRWHHTLAASLEWKRGDRGNLDEPESSAPRSGA